MSITTILGIVGGIAIIGGEYWLTGGVSETTIATGLSIMGLGYFSQDGKVFIPIIAKLLNYKRDQGQEVAPPPIAPPEKLPEFEHLAREEKIQAQRKKQSDKTKMNRVEND